MDVESIQKRLREFATERDWNQYHSPKNLSFASEVEAAELMEVFRFWADFDQPSKYIALFYNFDDLSWAEDELIGYGGPQKIAAVEARAPCINTICIGANSGLGIGPFPSVGVGRFGIHQPDSQDEYRYGRLHVLEYTHAVQASSWIGSSNHPQSGANNNSPRWLIEGNAHFAGTTNYEDYLALRINAVKSRHYKEPFNNYSRSKILDYYNNNAPFVCIGKSDYVLGYSVGFLTFEALSAITESNSSMYLYKYMSSGRTFEEAFEIIYGSSWEDAKPALASYVSSTINQFFN